MGEGAERENRPPDLYEKDHEVYTVHVKCIERSENGVAKLMFAKEVFGKIGKKCVYLAKIARDIMRMDVDSKETANKLVKDQPFPGKTVFIPFHAKYCVGVLREMDISLKDDEIIELFGGVFKNVYRMMRFDKVKQTKVPTTSVKITIECDELPEFITAYGMRCRVNTFEQREKACYKCHNFGHYENHCKAENKKCGHCGLYCIGKCENTKHCSSCNGDHIFGDEVCPVKKILFKLW